MKALPRVGVSRCLLGDEVRYDGSHKLELTLVEDLPGIVDWVPVCPELEVGMGVPREPIHLVAVAGSRRLVGVESGIDWTGRMHDWARRRIDELRGLRLSGFVLKARSPSCGARGVPVRDGDAGQGLFAEILTASMPDLPVEDEERLRDPDVRARFLSRVRTYRPGTDDTSRH